MEIIISNSNGIAIYEQIKNQIKSKIITNELQVGEQLPSIRALAKDLRCSVITTKNAYEELEKEGYVKTIPAKGIYVAPINHELAREEELKKLENLLDNVLQLAKINNIKKEEIIKMLNILDEETN